jgi:4-amino-4-deoxy-L-arabinose transferase-like glycosyltransferase
LKRSRLVASIIAILLVIAIGRIVATYNVTAQAFDEPCHVAAAIELLDRGTYRLDPYNTPLARIGIGIPLYLSGARLPHYAPEDATAKNYNAVGNAILQQGSSYQHSLTLARYGVLPLFLLSTLIVFFWCRREFGDLAAVVSVFLFTTLPVILAFSGIAYSDMAAAFAQPAAIFAFILWLEKPSRKRTVWLGVALGLALLAKFTTLLYLPAAAVSILAVRWLSSKRMVSPKPETPRSNLLLQTVAILLIATAVVWAGYGFSVGRVQESMGLSTASMPSFQHFPGPLRPLARALIERNPFVPAPGLLQGVASAYTFNKQAPPSYFMGQIKPGGWWYFFFVELALKSPPAFLLLSLVGVLALLRRRQKWTALSPVAAIFGILLATTTTHVYYGVRHVIALYPLLAIVAGYGASYLWRVEAGRRLAARYLLAALLACQVASSASAGRDFISYFNFVAEPDPSRLLVEGCDLDCGQDLIRLASELRARKVSHVTLALWTSADMSKTDLPPFEVAQPSRPVAGWFAISLRSLRAGDVFHETYPQNAFDWLRQYQPVQRVGQTILLYHIPDPTGPQL